MSASELLQALSQAGPVPGLTDSVARLLGASDFSAVPENQVLGFHLRRDTNFVAVYASTPKSFLLHEQSADGRAFSLVVPLARLRRVALLEDLAGARLTIELDSDRSTLVPVDGAPGSLVSVPAGYELVETTPEGRASLRSLQQALARASLYH